MELLAWQLGTSELQEKLLGPGATSCKDQGFQWGKTQYLASAFSHRVVSPTSLGN